MRVTTRVLSAIYVILLMLGVNGCKRENRKPIIINVLRDEKSRSFTITEPKLLQFESRQAKTSSGRPIVVQSIVMNEVQFDSILADQQRLSMMKPDLILMNSPDQAKAVAEIQNQSANVTNVCGAAANCPAFIPNWVSGEQLNAAQLVLRALSSSSS